MKTFPYLSGLAYECKARVSSPQNLSVLEEVRGEHEDGKKNYDVEVLNLFEQDQKVIPSFIDSFFPHVKGLHWTKSNLWRITANDLKQFPYLIYLDINNNKIVSLDSETFKYVPRLTNLNVHSNLIAHVGFDLLIKLKFLKIANFRYNPCIDKSSENLSYFTIEQLNDLLPKSCPPLPTSTTTKAPQITSTSPQTPSECSFDCIERVEALENQVAELQKQIKEIIANK
jgi:Leucine-rich repeat (LRR) protein